jgi:Lsr2
MARRTVVMLTDDLDGSDATETVRFSLDGRDYEVDLSKKNAKSLRDGLKRYVEVGRKTGGRRTRTSRSGGSAASDRAQLGAVRAWARQQGMEVSERGRISARVQEAYNKAH